jgi:hypothetical protein
MRQTRRDERAASSWRAWHLRTLPAPKCHSMAWSRAGRAVLLMRAVNNATPCKVKLLTAHWSTTGGQDLPAILLPIGSLTGCADIPFDLPCPCVSRVPSPCFNLALAPQQTKNPCSCTTTENQRISSRFTHQLRSFTRPPAPCPR